MLVFSPPFRGPDELIHFYRAYSISEGNLLCQVKTPPGGTSDESPLEAKWVGNEIPHPIQVTADRTVTSIEKPPIPEGVIASAFRIPATSSPRALVSYSMWSSIATYSPVAYLPQSLGVLLGRVFSLSPILLMYLARVFNLLAFAALVYFAIKVTPIQKWTMALIAVMPLSINLAASVSADGPAIGLSFLFTGYVLRLAFDEAVERVGRRELGLLLLLAVLLALSKPPYFLLVFLVLIIPARKMGGAKRYAVAFGLLAATALVVAGGWNLAVRSAYVPRLDSVEPGSQIEFIAKNPARYAWIVLRTGWTHKAFYAKSIVGGIGFLEVNLPSAFLASYPLAVAGFALFDTDRTRPSLGRKGVSLGVFLLVAIVTLTTFYVTWTPVGNRIIEGFQARYLLPALPLLVLPLSNTKLRPKDWWMPTAFAAYSCLTIAVTVFYMIRVYY